MDDIKFNVCAMASWWLDSEIADISLEMHKILFGMKTKKPILEERIDMLWRDNEHIRQHCLNEQKTNLEITEKMQYEALEDELTHQRGMIAQIEDDWSKIK